MVQFQKFNLYFYKKQYMTSKFFGNSKVKNNSKKEIKKNISNNSKRKAFAVRKTGRGK